VFSTAWAWPDQDLPGLFAHAHERGCAVMHMVSTLGKARSAAEAGADVVVAQGTEGAGHVGLMGTMVHVPQVVRAVAPRPVLAAGASAFGAGLPLGATACCSARASRPRPKRRAGQLQADDRRQ
jgi:hypothetical protein